MKLMGVSVDQMKEGLDKGIGQVGQVMGKGVELLAGNDDIKIFTDEYLIATISYDRHIVISSVNQRVTIYEMDTKNYLE